MSERKSIFFTSDWHLFHENSILYDSRPFTDLAHMHRALVNNYNSCVPKDGICYFLGDIGMAGGSKIKSVIAQLHGVKCLVLGNHDGKMNSMYNIGFDVVVNAVTMYIAKERVTLSHCPLRGVFREDVTGMKGAMPGDHWHGEHKNKAYSVNDEGQFHLHGHIHSGPKRGKRIDWRQFDIGVVANGYRPVSISQVESWITLTKEGKL